MTITHINPTPGATHTPAVVAAELAYTSGQVGDEAATGAVPSEFENEVRLALANFERVVQAAGSDMSRLVSVTCYIADVELVSIFNRIYLETVPEPRPARATAQVRMIPPYRIELACVCAVG